MNSQWDGPSRAGVTGGLLLTLLAMISTAAVWQTVILAALGATVSVVVSLLLKKVLKRWMR